MVQWTIGGLSTHGFVLFEGLYDDEIKVFVCIKIPNGMDCVVVIVGEYQRNGGFECPVAICWREFDGGSVIVTSKEQLSPR